MWQRLCGMPTLVSPMVRAVCCVEVERGQMLLLLMFRKETVVALLKIIAADADADAWA